jgi:hypothetical protein
VSVMDDAGGSTDAVIQMIINQVDDPGEFTGEFELEGIEDRQIDGVISGNWR